MRDFRICLLLINWTACFLMLFVCSFLHDYAEYVLTSLFSPFQINTAETGLFSGISLHLGTKICSQPVFQCLNSCLTWRPSMMTPWNGVFQRPSSSFLTPILYKLAALRSGSTVHSHVSLWATEVIHQLWRNNHRTLALPAAWLLLQSAFCLLNPFDALVRAPCRMRSCIISDPTLGSSRWGWAVAPRVEQHGELEGLRLGDIRGFVLPVPR